MSDQPRNGKAIGILLEFDSPVALIDAAEKVRDKGFTHWDTHSPFAVHGMNVAMGLKATRLPYFVFLCGTVGAFLGVFMQWWMNAYDFKYLISGKPFFSIPATVPIAFEITILFSAIGAFFGMLAFNRLPRFHHPVFHSERFKRVTTDKFFISIEVEDPKFDAPGTREFLESLGASGVEYLVDEGVEADV